MGVTPKQMDPTQAAARVALLKMGGTKRLLTRALDILLLPLVSFVRILNRSDQTKPCGEIRNILVVEYWNLGDVIILLPFLRNLRFCYPSARITLLVNPKAVALLEAEDLADELFPVRVPWAQHFNRWKKYNPFSHLWLRLARSVLALRRRRFDLAVTGRMDIRDNLLIWLIGARERVGYDLGGGGRFLTGRVTPDPLHPHRCQVWLRLLGHLGKPTLYTQPRLSLSERERAFAAQFLASHGIGPEDIILGVHSGARIATRGWGHKNFAAVEAQLASEFRLKTIWFSEPGAPVPAGLLRGRVVSAALGLRHFMAVLECCDLLICNDGGAMHIATALGVPVVGVFGPTQPAWFGPVGEQNRVVIRPEFWCRPCFEYCRFDQPYCLRSISCDQVLAAAREALHEVVGSPREAEPATACAARRTPLAPR